jgi:hypothetical protein
MPHINIEPSSDEEAQFDRAAEKLAEVVHRVVRRVVERSVRRLDSLKSTSIDAPIFNSPIIGKLKKD